MSFTIYDAFAFIGVELTPHHAPHSIRCPLHAGGQEQNPSCRVYPATDSAYCWTCGESWNPIALVAKARSLSYGEARWLVLKTHGSLTSSPRQAARLDHAIGEAIESIRYLAADRRRRAFDQLDRTVIAPAASGEPPWEVQTQLRAWTQHWFSSLL